MKNLMRYIWSNKLLPKEKLKATSGEDIEVINTGYEEKEGCCIYCDARIKIGEREWSGNVVLHTKSSNWEKEIQKNGCSAYENVILHITLNNDIDTLRKHGESIHQLCMQLPQELADEFEYAATGKAMLDCESAIASMGSIKMHCLMSRLLVERIEEKASRIRQLHKECDCNWEDTLFKLLARNFGFGVQSGTFEAWAALLDMKALGKHRDNLLQVEAIFFGQAGLLCEERIPYYYRNEALQSEYYNNLVREYKFLKSKFGLKEIDGKMWGLGNATPHLRIARLATLYSNGRATMSAIADCNTTAEVRNLLQSRLEGYWTNHLQFGSTDTKGNPPMRNRQLDLLIINTVAPMLYAYGKHRNNQSLCNNAEDFLHNLDSEDNNIIRRWAAKGIEIGCAADSQAVIQLQKAYCNRHRCTECHLAYTYIKEKICL